MNSVMPIYLSKVKLPVRIGSVIILSHDYPNISSAILLI